MKILVVRFRQMGDSVVATALLNTLRYNFPESQIHFVLNEKIAPLFQGHPSIDRIITFSEDDHSGLVRYLKKVWQIVHDTRYDVIIDMRSTLNTMMFACFSRRTPYRIGLKKFYTRIAFNHLIHFSENKSMVEHDVSLASPLNAIKEIYAINEFTLHISEEEKKDFGDYLRGQGVDLEKPIILVNVTAKIASKVWHEDRMVWVLKQFLETFPTYQVVFNYAPGPEEANARRVYEKLGRPQQVFIDVQARSSRELVAMGYYMTLFFGNEGGARHIIHATGCPSLVVCAPKTNKTVWLQQNSVPAEGISPADFADSSVLKKMSNEQKYNLITQEVVWEKLKDFTQRVAQVSQKLSES
ncbi:MAG: glycosyltransferase family 9 protein [Muribaculaceae bacterium]|nr:glycosyltransferase family 9 protein [Muribaculaceae bacterium]